MNTLPIDVPLIIMASACWDTPAPVNVHHIARRFAARGHRVLFVESTGLRAPSLASSHDSGRVRRRLKNWRDGVRRIDDRLAVLSPLALPWTWPMPARRYSLKWIGRAVRRAAAQLEFERPIIWSFLPTALRVPDALDHRAVVYHCVDHYAANPGVDRAFVDDLERQMMERADLVLATSPALRDRLATLRDDVICVPNVADIDLFSTAVTDDLDEPAALAGVARPRAVYVGNLAQYRIDIDLLTNLAAERPDVQFVFIGAIGLGDTTDAQPALAGLGALPNTHFVPPQPQGDLPAFLRHCDVALIPFLDNEHTRGSLPLKLWEYVGAGLPVIATTLDNFAAPERQGVVRCARGAGAFAAAIDACLHQPGLTPEQRVAIAREHDWAARIDELAEMLARVA